jgi:trk system potassium uptake protein TrkH
MLKNKDIYIIPFLGFLAIILTGWVILMLPFCNNGSITIFDAFFTSTSATCVNGLVTVDLSQEYTFLGQIVIAIITEIGAIGFVTFISFILNLKRKKMALSETLLLSSALNDNNYSKLRLRLKEVIKYTLVIELIGSIFLSIAFVPMYGVKQGVWYSIFHSITAFCNAGFDLFGTSGFTIFTDNIYINVVFIILMFLGSVGFFVIEDIINSIKEKRFIHLSFNTKIVLTTTLIIYLLSVILIKIAEPNLTILQVLFSSVTCRTTGFSTINMGDTNSITKIIISLLMMIGGAPSSTSGGIRITSIAIIFLTIRSALRNKKDVISFYKKIDFQTIKQALTNIFISSIIVFIAILLFVKIQDIELSNVLFMCVSAFSATGLSVVDVSNLEFISKVILMILMFIGRVGPISILSIFIFNKKENKNIEYVSGNIML